MYVFAFLQFYILFTQCTILGFLRKRLANVQTPQKKQGPTPKRGVPSKKRRLNFSPSDEETSGSGSTMILTPTSDESMGIPSPGGDTPAPEDPDSSE